MGRTIILVHGRHFKPSRSALRRLWMDALRSGIARDHPRRLRAFDRCRIGFVYYGDLSNRFLTETLRRHVPDDLADRRTTLSQLKAYRRRDFSRSTYRDLPGCSAAGEAMADALAGLLGKAKLLGPLLEHVAPDLREYWNFDSKFGSLVRGRMITPLRSAMNRGDRILVIAHSLGTLLAYDTLWKFSHTSEYRPRYTFQPIDLFLTLGGPLGDETVKTKLKGALADGPRRYPGNIRHWLNVAAEDDYIAHDQRIANDYRDMIGYGLTKSIRDERIYGLAVRNGRSNPHSSAGYLLHPFVTERVSAWTIGK